MKRHRISPFDILKFNVRIASNIETRINNIQKDGAFIMDLTKKEKNALVSILKTEMIEVKDLIVDEEISKKRPRYGEHPKRGRCHAMQLGARSLMYALFQARHEVVGLDGFRGEAVILPPRSQCCTDGEARRNHLFELGVVDGQQRFARCAEQLICQGEAQHSSAGQRTGGDLLFHFNPCLSRASRPAA